MTDKLTDKEKIVLKAIQRLYRKHPSYLLHKDTADALKGAVPKRSLAGIYGSLQSKGWVFCFEKPGDDIEVTCMAAKEWKMPTSGCNHPECFCSNQP